MKQKMIPIAKQSKTNQRKFYAEKRNNWNGVSPVSRIVESRKEYDRKRMKQADRRNIEYSMNS